MNFISASENDSPKLDVLMASLYYLLTRYAVDPAPDLEKMIIDHFGRLHQHPDNESPILKSTGKRLLLQWAKFACNRCLQNAKDDSNENSLVKLSKFDLH